MGAARWGVLAACLAAAVAVLALVAGATGGQQRPAPALPAASGPGGDRLLDGPWIVRGDHAGRGVALGWRKGDFGGRTVTMPFSPNARHVRGVAGERSFAGSVAWYRTTVTLPRAGVYAMRFESVNHRADVWVDGRLVTRHTGTYLPFEARARLAAGRARARRARRLARPRGDEGRRLAPHVVQLRRRQRAGVDPRRWGRASSRRPRSSPGCSGNDAVVDVAVGVTNRAGPRTIAVRGTLAGDRAALRAGDAGPAAPAPPSAPGCGSRARTCGSRATRRSRICASRSPASRVFTAARRAARAALGRRAAAAQRRAAEAARRLAAGGRAGPRRRAHRRRRRRDRRAAEGHRRQRHAQPAPAERRRCSTASTPRGSSSGRASARSTRRARGRRARPCSSAARSAACA